MATQTDIRVMVPRVRRAIEGVGAVEVLTDDAIKDLIADAIADIILYTGGVFGKELVVTDSEEGSPTEYATSDALSLAEQSIVAAQAALNHFFHMFINVKISEKIGDEAQTWEYGRSANLLKDQLAYLIRMRDEALAQIEQTGALDSYESFIAVRDAHVSALIEPWVDAAGGGSGQEDFRFGTVG